MSEYDPVLYWREEGKTYIDHYEHNGVYQKQEKILLNYLKNLQFRSVLELGCGFGRLTNLIMDNFDIDDYVALDVSPDQLSHLKPRKNLQRVNGDIMTFNPSRKFDLILSAEVLMHQLPSHISSIIAKMKLMSNKHIINIDYFCEEDVELADFNFKHNYIALYGKSTVIQIDRQALFHHCTR